MCCDDLVQFVIVKKDIGDYLSGWAPLAGMIIEITKGDDNYGDSWVVFKESNCGCWALPRRWVIELPIKVEII